MNIRVWPCPARLIIQRLFIHKQEPDVGPGEQLSLQGKHRKILNGKPCFINRLCLDIHCANPPVLIKATKLSLAPKLIGTPSPILREKKGVYWYTKIAKQVAVLNKELPAFRKE